MKTLLNRIFGRRKEKIADEINVPSINSDAVYQSLIDGLDRMETEGVDRIILTLYESEPSQNVRGRWLNFKEDTNYYPFEMLDKTEQDMIRDGKTYRVIALVRDNVGDVVRYADKGVADYLRTHIFPVLPRLKPESELNYVTEGGAHTGDNLKQFAGRVAGNGWNHEAIDQRVRSGIEEYDEITKKLMDNAGVYSALEKMDQRKYSPFERLMFSTKEENIV